VGGGSRMEYDENGRLIIPTGISSEKNKYIDTTFDVRIDSRGKDPDSSSKTLRHYHKLLWSKNLPNGKLFNLDDAKANRLYHKSELGEYYLSSDSIIHTYSKCKWPRIQHIIQQIPEDEIKYFFDLASTMGGYILFPANRINGANTINGERGFNSKIKDVSGDIITMKIVPWQIHSKGIRTFLIYFLILKVIVNIFYYKI
jgi:hypothetical protein